MTTAGATETGRKIEAGDRRCAGCGQGPRVLPRYAGPATSCEPCWTRSVEEARELLRALKPRRIHRNALASEYELSSSDRPVARVFLFRDGLTLCVRFLSALNGSSAVVLEEFLKSLLGSWPHDYLESEIIPAEFPVKQEEAKK